MATVQERKIEQLQKDDITSFSFLPTFEIPKK